MLVSEKFGWEFQETQKLKTSYGTLREREGKCVGEREYTYNNYSEFYCGDGFEMYYKVELEFVGLDSTDWVACDCGVYY